MIRLNEKEEALYQRAEEEKDPEKKKKLYEEIKKMWETDPDLKRIKAIFG